LDSNDGSGFHRNREGQEENQRWEGQSPFNKVLKQYDFIYIFLKKRLAKRWTPLNNIMPLKNTLGNKVHEVVSGTLIVGPVAGRRLGSLLFLLHVSLASGFLVSHS
jgi:hypothetical protein